MNRTTPLSVIAIVLAASAAAPAQGPLTPPGAPAPTMKSLDQVEARTPIGAAPFTITASGSYYLTSNLTVAAGNAITISASGVTLDLNGFTITSTSPTPDGVAIEIVGGPSDLAISNGHVRSGTTYSGGVYGGTGFNHGIAYDFAVCKNVRVSNVTVTGVKRSGIYLTNSILNSANLLVENCSVRTAGEYGIWATLVKNCCASECGAAAIGATLVEGSHGSSTASHGIDCGTASDSRAQNTSVGYVALRANTVMNCYAYSSGSGAIDCTTAQNCTAESLAGVALNAKAASFCTASRSAGVAIQATVANGCTVTSGTTSIFAKYNMP